MSSVFISFVITTYNRIKAVHIAIQSVLDQQENNSKLCEIIIVDDASSDGTLEYLKERYAEQIKTRLIKLKYFKKNIGVTGAKNSGYDLAKGAWVIFLDSDDYLTPRSLIRMTKVLIERTKNPIVFFRCIDENGVFVGKEFSANKTINICEYLHHAAYGEALTAVNKQLVQDQHPYLTELRGYEGFGCSKIIFHHGAAVLSTVVARIYVQNNDDRLSAKKGLLKRLSLLAKGHFMMFKEFKHIMPWKLKIVYLTKAILYYIAGYFYKMSGVGK